MAPAPPRAEATGSEPPPPRQKISSAARRAAPHKPSASKPLIRYHSKHYNAIALATSASPTPGPSGRGVAIASAAKDAGMRYDPAWLPMPRGASAKPPDIPDWWLYDPRRPILAQSLAAPVKSIAQPTLFSTVIFGPADGRAADPSLPPAVGQEELLPPQRLVENILSNLKRAAADVDGQPAAHLATPQPTVAEPPVTKAAAIETSIYELPATYPSLTERSHLEWTSFAANGPRVGQTYPGKHNPGRPLLARAQLADTPSPRAQAAAEQTAHRRPQDHLVRDQVAQDYASSTYVQAQFVPGQTASATLAHAQHASYPQPGVDGQSVYQQQLGVLPAYHDPASHLPSATSANTVSRLQDSSNEALCIATPPTTDSSTEDSKDAPEVAYRSVAGDSMAPTRSWVPIQSTTVETVEGTSTDGGASRRSTTRTRVRTHKADAALEKTPTARKPAVQTKKDGQPKNSRKAKNVAATSADTPQERCCPDEVPSTLIMVLDGQMHAGMAPQYLAVSDLLCPAHRKEFDRIVPSANRPKKSDAPAQPTKATKRKRLTESESRAPAKTEQTKSGAGTPENPGLSAAPTAPAESSSRGSVKQKPPRPATDPPRGLTKAGKLPLLAPDLPETDPQIPASKKRRTTDSGRGFRQPKAVPKPATCPEEVRPVHNPLRDSDYRKHMVAELEARMKKNERGPKTHGSSTDTIIHSLLQNAEQPRMDLHNGPLDVYFLSGDEASSMLESGSPTIPIVTEKQQTFKWSRTGRPIAELFRRMEDLDREVSVQIPSRPCTGDSFESRALTLIRDRFLAEKETDNPWNILDLRSPIPAAILPGFLTGENCQLLPRLRDSVLMGGRAERGLGSRDQWNEWRDVLEWVLLSEGGHNTSPHTDSHGLATWITVQEGLFGFGWLSSPSDEVRDAWMSKPQSFVGGKWKYLIIEPGQTIFFNSGTIHFVFRLRSEQTLALGGHLLQWSGVERWIEVVMAQMKNPHITNEEMEWSAPKYVRVVAELIEARRRNGRVDEMGGEVTVQRVLGLLKEFDEKYVRPQAKKSKSKKKRAR